MPGEIIPPHTTRGADTLYCSFCGKSQHEVKKIITGPTVFICDECVILCLDILLQDGSFTLESIAEELQVFEESRKAPLQTESPPY